MTTTTPTQATSDETAPSESSGVGGALLWSFLLIAALTTYTGIMIRGSYFYADDFLTFGYAHKLGLSWSLLSVNLFGHIAPTERFLHYVPLAISPFNYAVGESIILILYALLLLSFLWVLRELRVGTLVTLTLLFVTGTSTILLNETLYYDQTVFLLPASIFILCVTALFLRWCRTGQVRALVASWFVFALLFVTQERPLVVLVYLVALRYIVLPYRQAPGGKRRWLSDWRIWLPFAVIGGAYFAWYLSIAPSSSTRAGTIGNFVRLIGDAFVRLTLGLPITGSAWIAWVGLVALLAVLVSLLVLSQRRQLVLRAGVFFLACFLVNLGVVYHGVGGVVGVAGVADQIQYYVDTFFALGIAVGTVCSPWVWQARISLEHLPRHRRAPARSPRSLRSGGVAAVAFACAAVVVVHVALLPFGVSSVDRGNSTQPIGRAWMANVQASLAHLGSRPVTILPLNMPTTLVPGFESPFNFQSETLPLLRQWHGDDTGPVKITGPTGALVNSSAGDSVTVTPTTLPVTEIGNLKPVSGPTGASCYRGNHGEGTLVVSLPHAVSGGVIAYDMSIVASTKMSMLSVAVGKGPPRGSPIPTSVPRGTSRILAPLASLPSHGNEPNPVNAMGFRRHQPPFALLHHRSPSRSRSGAKRHVLQPNRYLREAHPAGGLRESLAWQSAPRGWWHRNMNPSVKHGHDVPGNGGPCEAPGGPAPTIISSLWL